MDKECADLHIKLNEMVDELNTMIRKKKQEDKDYEGDFSESKKIIFVST